jgi:7-cyano-7-deazaguanine reductase
MAKKSKISGRKDQELGSVSLLGNSKTDYPSTYSPDVLEKFPNKNPGSDAWTSFICTEFTSLCPKTGQPDFAKIFVNYVADKEMVESKSLKIYLFCFRNHGDFHEDCVQKICDDLARLMKPKYIEVMGDFTPRGGIAIFPYASKSNGSKEFEELRRSRMANYAPGKYGMALDRLY